MCVRARTGCQKPGPKSKSLIFGFPVSFYTPTLGPWLIMGWLDHPLDFLIYYLLFIFIFIIWDMCGIIISPNVTF
jgi:hypothetical protein